MKVDDLSFRAKIRFINEECFQNKIRHLSPKKHYVGYPWTADTIKSGKNLYTTQIMDCIAGGIVDASRITMFHFGIYNQKKAKIKHQKGFSIENAKRRLLEKINLKNDNLHGIILGGFQLNPDDKYNVNVLNKIKKFFEEHNIPYSIFGARKDVHYFGYYSLFYSNKEDTWYITNNLTKSRALAGNKKEIEIKKGNLEYNTYEKNDNKFGVTYKCIRQKTGTEEFFKSQFRDVFISKRDELI